MFGYPLAFCFIIFIQVCLGQYELTIKPAKGEFLGSLGSGASFSCEVCDLSENGDDGNIVIQWFNNHNKEVNEDKDERVVVNKDGTKAKKLVIRKIIESDAGDYRCSVKVGRYTDSKHIKLSVFKDMSFDHAPNPQHPSIHTTAIIECQVSGVPAPEVSWKFNGKRIVYGDKYKQLTKGLQIKNISLSDNGNYTCIAEIPDSGKYDERRITVVVHVPPVMIHGPGHQKGVAGQEISLYCKAESDPMPSYEFFKGKTEKLLSTDRIQVDSHLGKLTFKPLRKEDHGMYKCKALNDVGDASANGTLHVLVAPHIYELRNITVSENQDTKLVCKSQGDPAPMMLFQKSGHSPLKNGSNEGGRINLRNRQSNVLELEIKKVQPHDSMDYVCIARNSAGEHNATNHLTVNYQPKFPSDHIKEVHSWSGRLHNITCHAHAHPQPTFQWWHLERQLTNNETFNIFSSNRNSSLQIRVKEADQSWIFGEYICRAINNKGSKDMKILLSRASLPDAPSDVVVKENTPNMLIINVKPPFVTGGVKLLGYRIEYNNKVTDFATMYANHTTTGSQGDDLKMENLKPATQYRFKVRSKNEVGVGDFRELLVTTSNATKPFPLKLISSKQSKEPWSYKIVWEKPKTGGKPVKEYEIRYKRVRVKQDGSLESLENWVVENKRENTYKPSLEHILTNLDPKTNYQLQVFAKTDLGISPQSERFVFKTAAESYKMGLHHGKAECIHQRKCFISNLLIILVIIHKIIHSGMN